MRNSKAAYNAILAPRALGTFTMPISSQLPPLAVDHVVQMLYSVASLVIEDASRFRSSTRCSTLCVPDHRCSSALNSRSTNCSACLTGTFAASEGSGTCDVCTAGFFSNALGRDKCLGCPSGTFSNDTQFVECFRCGVGKRSVKITALPEQQGTLSLHASVCVLSLIHI